MIMRSTDNTAKNPTTTLVEAEADLREEEPRPGGMDVNAEVGAVPTTAVAVVGTVAVVIQAGHMEGALLTEV